MNNSEATSKILNIRVSYSEAIQGIAEYQKKIETLKEREKELSVQLKTGGITRSEYRKEMAAIKEATKEYQAEIRVLSKEIQDDIKLQKQQEGSIAQLRKMLSDAKQAYVNMSKAEREAAKGKELQQHILSLNDEIKDMEAEIGVFSRNVGNYEESIKKALGVNNDFANSLLNMSKSGGGLKGMLNEAGTAAKAFLSTLTGFLANPVFLALAGIAGTGVVFKWWFDYNKGLMEATRLTQEFTGLTGDRLKAVRNEIQATADVYGKDFREVLGTADALMAQYGLTAEEAMTVIQDGFQAGADEGGNMLSRIKDLAPQFHDAGIAADEMMAIMAQTRSGIFSEGGMDIIAMASKRIREMSTGTEKALNDIGISAKQVQEDLESGAKSTFDVIQEVAVKLREMPQDSQEVGNVLKDVFGRQGAAAGLQMIEQLDTMTKDIEEVKKVTGEYGESTREQMEKQKELNNVVSAMFDVTDKGFEVALVHVKTYVTEGLVQMLQWMVKAINYTIDFYNESMVLRGVFQSLTFGFKLMWNTAKTAFNLIVDAVKSVVRSFKGLALVMEGIFTFNWDKIKEGIKTSVDNIGQTIKDGFDDVKGYVNETIDDIVGGVKSTIGDAKVPPITIPVTVDNPDIPGVTKNGASSNPEPDSGERDDVDRKKSDAAAKARVKEEREEAKHRAQMAKIIADGEKSMLSLITSNLARQRQAINVEYNNQIADLKNKLATEAKLTEDARKSINSQIIALEQEKQRKLIEFDDARVKALAEQRAVELSKEIELTQEGTQKRLELVRQQLTEEYDGRRTILEQKIKEQSEFVLQITSDIARATEEGRTEEEITAMENRLDVEEEMLRSYNSQLTQIEEEKRVRVAEAQDEFDNTQMEKVRQVYQNQIDELMLKDDRTEEEGRRILDIQRQQAEEYLRMLEERGLTETQTTEEYNEQVIAAKQKLVEAEKSIQEYEAEIEQSRLQAASTVMGGITKLTSAIGQNNKEMAQLSKIVTLAQIAIDTGKAISAGIASASSLPYPANLTAIATTVANVLANIATAVSAVNSARFAHGGVAGLVDGKIDDDKDRLMVRVNKGEMILNEVQQKRLYKTLTGKDGELTEDAQRELFGIADGKVVAPVEKSSVTDTLEQGEVIPTKPSPSYGDSGSGSDKRDMGRASKSLTEEQRKLVEKIVSDEVEVAISETSKTMSLQVGSESTTLTDEQRSRVRDMLSEDVRSYAKSISEELVEGIVDVSETMSTKIVLDEEQQKKLYSVLSEGLPVSGGTDVGTEESVANEQRRLIGNLLEDSVKATISNADGNLSLRIEDNAVILTEEQRNDVKRAFEEDLADYQVTVMKEISDRLASESEEVTKSEMVLTKDQKRRLHSIMEESLSLVEQSITVEDVGTGESKRQSRKLYGLMEKMVTGEMEVALTNVIDTMTVHVGTESMDLTDGQRRNVRKAFSEELRAYEDSLTRDTAAILLDVASEHMVLNKEQRKELHKALSVGVGQQSSGQVRESSGPVVDGQHDFLDRIISDKVEVALSDASEKMMVRVGTETVTLTEEQRNKVRKAFTEELKVYEEALSREVSNEEAAKRTAADRFSVKEIRDDVKFGRTLATAVKEMLLPVRQQPLDFTPITSSFAEIGGGSPVSSRRIYDTVAAESGMVDQMAETIENLPAPIVSVEDINDGQRRVQVIENIDTL